MPRAEAVRIPIDTLLGTFMVGFSDCALIRVQFPDSVGAVGRSEKSHPLFEVTQRCLEDMLAGKAPESLPPLDLSQGTAFQRSVWEAMLAIPLGSTLTYGEIARAIDNPGATQAVGTACGANPIPVIVPCHRILGGSGIGGFSSGLDWKIKLLQIEGVSLL
jgi:methylated-DNA-[protein]-cysteine S-methyltransferase